MKKILILFAILFLSNFLFAEAKIDSLIYKGMQYRHQGKFGSALEYYGRAYQDHADSPLLNYELAVTFTYIKEYEEAIKYCDKVIDLNKKYVLHAYITKGTCYSYLGKEKKAIKIFGKALDEFGTNHLLLYHMGKDYYKLGDYEEAEIALTNAIIANTNHAKSHFQIASLMQAQRKSIQSILSYYYFLFLQPTSQNSLQAHQSLLEQLSKNTEKNNQELSKSEILLKAKKLEADFDDNDDILALLKVYPKLEEIQPAKTSETKFIQNTRSLFKILEELEKKEDNQGLWWEFYIPFFTKILNSEHMETFCHYINQVHSEVSTKWIENNQDKLNAFSEWLKFN